MANIDFDKVIDRRNTRAAKTDALKELFGKEDLIPLWIADMDFEVCPEIAKAITDRVAHHIYGYSRPSEEYWQSIIDWQKEKHNFSFTREELDYVPGVVKGIAFAVNYFTKEGDKIVIQPPVYHPFKMVIEGNKRIVLSNPLIQNDNKYQMDLEGLEKIFATEKPKMLILCNPHNPIGIIWGKDTLAKLASLCKKYGVLVISDEIHSDLAVFDNVHIPFATASKEAEEISILLGAPSKTFNIPGVVSSWVVIKNKELRDGFFKWLAANEYNEPTFFATIATEAAYTKGGKWLAEAKKYIEDNIVFVEDYCAKNLPGVRAIRPEASFLIWLDCSRLNLDHKKLIDLFVNKAGLALNDGEMFGAEGEHCMRMNVGTSRKLIEQALSQLATAIKEM
ncbi:MAG: pyridoxal phosphate-dependent aminotransferase [Muribaculaceae bacterium]|nr:pyridoxal phosphate-dependent aminotransferase [Muribaculaceae bacterium]